MAGVKKIDNTNNKTSETSKQKSTIEAKKNIKIGIFEKAKIVKYDDADNDGVVTKNEVIEQITTLPDLNRSIFSSLFDIKTDKNDNYNIEMKTKLGQRESEAEIKNASKDINNDEAKILKRVAQEEHDASILARNNLDTRLILAAKKLNLGKINNDQYKKAEAKAMQEYETEMNTASQRYLSSTQSITRRLEEKTETPAVATTNENALSPNNALEAEIAKDSVETPTLAQAAPVAQAATAAIAPAETDAAESAADSGDASPSIEGANSADSPKQPKTVVIDTVAFVNDSRQVYANNIYSVANSQTNYDVWNNMGRAIYQILETYNSSKSITFNPSDDETSASTAPAVAPAPATPAASAPASASAPAAKPSSAPTQATPAATPAAAPAIEPATVPAVESTTTPTEENKKKEEEKPINPGS
jgi:hypothetical protein